MKQIELFCIQTSQICYEMDLWHVLKTSIDNEYDEVLVTLDKLRVYCIISTEYLRVKIQLSFYSKITDLKVWKSGNWMPACNFC